MVQGHLVITVSPPHCDGKPTMYSSSLTVNHHQSSTLTLYDTHRHYVHDSILLLTDLCTRRLDHIHNNVIYEHIHVTKSQATNTQLRENQQYLRQKTRHTTQLSVTRPNIKGGTNAIGMPLAQATTNKATFLT